MQSYFSLSPYVTDLGQLKYRCNKFKYCIGEIDKRVAQELQSGDASINNLPSKMVKRHPKMRRVRAFSNGTKEENIRGLNFQRSVLRLRHHEMLTLSLNAAKERKDDRFADGLQQLINHLDIQTWEKNIVNNQQAPTKPKDDAPGGLPDTPSPKPRKHMPLQAAIEAGRKLRSLKKNQRASPSTSATPPPWDRRYHISRITQADKRLRLTEKSLQNARRKWQAARLTALKKEQQKERRAKRMMRRRAVVTACVGMGMAVAFAAAMNGER